MSISKYLWMLVILASCATAKNFYDASSQITFKKTPCFGRCPEFTLTIKGDGNCILNGTKNITHIGNFNLKLDDAETKSIFEDFQKAGFDTLQEKYLSKATDLPSSIFTLTHNGKTKTVTAQMGMPDALKAIDKRLTELAERESWKSAE